MYDFQNEISAHQDYRQQIGVQYLPPVVVERYINQWVTTSIPGYGQVVAYILDYNPRTGMVSMFIYAPPGYRQQFIQVHHSDLIGISPYFGPTPPRPRPPQPPRPPSPWQPSPWQPSPWQPGPGGGFWPWLWYGVGTALGGGQQR